jgi:Uma2 family endonuclease
MTPEEFDALEEGQYEEGYRYELVNGVLVVNAIPLEQHAEPNEVLGYWLRRYQEEHPQGRSVDATLPERYIPLAKGRRLADRVIWVGLGRKPNPRQDIPTIAVEFVSEGKRSWRRDYLEKRGEYLEAGVKEYWIVDRFRRTLTVFTPGANGYDEKVIGEQETYLPPLLPGFELPLAKLLAAADKWTE